MQTDLIPFWFDSKFVSIINSLQIDFYLTTDLQVPRRAGPAHAGHRMPSRQSIAMVLVASLRFLNGYLIHYYKSYRTCCRVTEGG